MSPSEIALRRAGPETETHLDDVVVKDVRMFRAEMLDAKTLWLCCYLPNDDRITWHVHSRRGTLEFDVGEMPDEFVDFDAA